MGRLLASFLAAAMVLTAVATCRAEGEIDRKELEIDHALTFEFPTPHTDWAQPDAMGKTRVLFFTNGMGTHPRECVELMQRFDLEAKAVFWSQIVDTSRTHWHGGEIGLQRMSALLQQKWDCFVFMGLPLGGLPAQQQYALLKAVSEGAGLVLVGVDDTRVLKAKSRLAESPATLGSPAAGDAYRVGQGRGIRLPQRPTIAYQEGWQVEDDYWHERLGRAVLWAAGKDRRMEIRLETSKPEFASAEPEKQLRVTVKGTPVGQRPLLSVWIRRTVDDPIRWPAREFAADTPLVLPLPQRLPAGVYHAVAQAIGSKGVEAWSTAAFQVTSDRRVTDVNLAQDWGEIGERIAGTVALEGTALPGETLRVCLLDRRRRELARQDLPAAKTGAEFAFPVRSWMPMLVTVEARLLSGSDETSRAWNYFRVTKRNRGQFNFLMWDFPTGTLAPYAEESLARTGVTLQLNGSPAPPRYLAAFDVAYVPYTTRILAKRSPEGGMQPFCWNDAAAVQRHVDELARKNVPARQHGVFVYSLGDENETRGCCTSPHCVRAYRAYLEEVYGNLDALNRSWGTAFAEWDEVGLAKPDDLEEAAALAQKDYPRWFDRQAFKSYNYAKYCQQYARAYKRIDPQAKTGFEGAGGFAHGDDLDLIVRSVDFWAPYPSQADEVIRSMAPREFPRANWMGYTKDADSLLAKYWRMVTRGSDAVWWWRWDCIGAFHGWLAPDLRPYPAVKEILADTQVMRDGLGDLLLQSQMQDDGVAMLFSYPSSFARKLAEGATYGDYEGGHLRMQQVLRDLGLQYRYVTDRMLKLGEFVPLRYRVLVLCRAEALGDKEAEAIRRFVTEGGTVIADVRPGIYDDRCKPRPAGVLDDLFGIARSEPVKALPARLATHPDVQSPLQLEKVLVDSAVKIQAASAISQATAEGAPTLISRSVGKGRAILLNFAAASYPKPGTADSSAQAAAMFHAILKSAGVSASLLAKDADAAPARNLEVIRWANGNQQIVALLREGGLQQQVTVELADGKSRHVYDLRQRKALGPLVRLTTTILPNRASFFILAGKPLNEPLLTLDQTVTPRGSVIKGTMSLSSEEAVQPYRLCVRVAGQEIEYLRRIVMVGRQPAGFDLPIAYNDPAGEYEVLAIDLLDRVQARCKLTVR